MIVGIPKEIKDNEYRVAMVPSGVRALREAGHTVLIEAGAGLGSSITDEEYREAGAEVIDDAARVWARSDMIVKVKEPLPEEHRHLRDGMILFTFLHLAANKMLTEALIRCGGTAIGYETVEDDSGRLPILAPMSEIAGRLSVQAAAHYLMKHNGGSGVLLSGVPGVGRGEVAIVGAGNVGMNAAKMAIGLGARVTVLDTNPDRLRYLDDIYGNRMDTSISSSYNIERAVRGCDILIGAVHVPGARTPRLVSRGMVAQMKKGSVIIDVSVDQGGCVETIRQTTYSEPVYEIDGVLHYGVANMPGAVPRTSTYALTNATLPYVLGIATLGLREAVKVEPSVGRAVNVHRSRITHPAVAEATRKEYTELSL